MIDSKRITQVFSILINNALSYTPENSKITLFLKAHHSHVELGVADNGPGINDESKKNVFKRFYRLDSSRNSDSHCGLGLSIAQEILKAHDTKLILTDTPGGGCTFKFILYY